MVYEYDTTRHPRDVLDWTGLVRWGVKKRARYIPAGRSSLTGFRLAAAQSTITARKARN